LTAGTVDNDVLPYVRRVMKNCRILELLSTLAGSVQVSFTHHIPKYAPLL